MRTLLRMLGVGALVSAVTVGCTTRDEDIETETTPRTQEEDTLEVGPPDTLLAPPDTLLAPPDTL